MLQYISIYIIYVNFSVASLLKCLLAPRKALLEVAISIPYLVCVLLFNHGSLRRNQINEKYYTRLDYTRTRNFINEKYNTILEISSTGNTILY